MDVDAVRHALIADREQTQARIAAMSAELEAVANASAGSNLDDEHDPEGSTVAFEREQFAAVRAQAQAHLGDIEAALERLAGSRYGICEACGNSIASERLDALPATRRCIACARGVTGR
jgi:RNA polymerase-binding transcription factor DksA